MKEARGVVKAFAKDTGEGVIVLESGIELPFFAQYVSYSDGTSTTDVVIGDTATVGIRFNSMGKRRAEAVTLDRPPPKPMSFTAAFKELRALGFLTAWQLADAKRAVLRLQGELPKRFTREHARDLLADYYGIGPTDRAIQDHYLAHDWRFGQETNDIVAEFVRVLGCPPATQTKNDSDGLVVADATDASATVTVRDDLSQLAQFFQSRFDALAIPRRLIEIVTHDDQRIYVTRDASVVQPFRTAGSLEARVL
jgi:hypothetical protein